MIDDFEEVIHDFDEVIRDFDEVIDDFKEVIHDFGEVIDDFGEAIDDFREAIDDFEEVTDDFEEVIDDFEEVIDDFPTQQLWNIQALTLTRDTYRQYSIELSLGALFENIDEPVTAREWYVKAILQLWPMKEFQQEPRFDDFRRSRAADSQRRSGISVRRHYGTLGLRSAYRRSPKLLISTAAYKRSSSLLAGNREARCPGASVINQDRRVYPPQHGHCGQRVS